MTSPVSHIHLSVKLIVVAIAAVVGASAAPGSAGAAPSHPSHGRPVIRTAPSTAPPGSRRHGSCHVPSRSSHTVAKTHGLVWVRHHPTGVVSIWLPGFESKRCQPARRVSGAKIARRLAAAVDRAAREPKGIFCPRDDGTSVVLYLTYADGSDEYVDVSFGGCHTLGAPGRAPRESSQAISRDLKSVAPRAWASYL